MPLKFYCFFPLFWKKKPQLWVLFQVPLYKFLDFRIIQIRWFYNLDFGNSKTFGALWKGGYVEFKNPLSIKNPQKRFWWRGFGVLGTLTWVKRVLKAQPFFPCLGKGLWQFKKRNRGGWTVWGRGHSRKKKAPKPPESRCRDGFVPPLGVNPAPRPGSPRGVGLTRLGGLKHVPPSSDPWWGWHWF